MQEEELDDIVQQLAVAKYALAAHDVDRADGAVDAALALARRMMTARRGPSLLRTHAAQD